MLFYYLFDYLNILRAQRVQIIEGLLLKTINSSSKYQSRDFLEFLDEIFMHAFSILWQVLLCNVYILPFILVESVDGSAEDDER